MTTTSGTAASALPATGGTSMQGLADWAAPYITDYLGKAQALGGKDYSTYAGPLTAGESGLQSKVFQGLGALSFPSNLGQSFVNVGAPALPSPTDVNVGGSTSGPVDTYMNPYLQSVLSPQLDELRRQSQITQMGNAAKMTGAGAFGGSRQAIMDAETQRNLMQEMNKTVGAGYASAYDKAMNQFNTEQGQAKTLVDMMSQAGATQRGITGEGIAADLAEFNAQREYPYKQVQFMRDMISGLPTSSVTNTPAQMSGIAQLISSVGGIDKLLQTTGQGSLSDLLSNLGLKLGSESVLP